MSFAFIAARRDASSFHSCQCGAIPEIQMTVDFFLLPLYLKTPHLYMAAVCMQVL
jgi:hypothetical protein